MFIKLVRELSEQDHDGAIKSCAFFHVRAALVGISDFARFTFSSPGNTLPLIWGSFNPQCLTNQVRINWKTEQEQITASFIIRHSPEGSSWTAIATLPAAGNSNLPLSYSIPIDPQSLAVTSYYQVLQRGLLLGDGVEAQKFSFARMLNRITTVEFCTSLHHCPTDFGGSLFFRLLLFFVK